MPEYNGYNPEENEFAEGRKKIIIADIGTAMRAHAKDIAADRSTESTEKPQGFWGKTKNFGKTVWKRSEISRVIEESKARKQIREKGTVFAGVEKGENQEENRKKEKEDHDKMVKHVTDRFSASGEYEGQFIHKEAGEHREQLGNSHEENVIKSRIQGLIKSYAKGDLDEAGFYGAKDKIFADLYGIKKEVFDKGEMYADNLFDIAKWAKEEVRRQAEQMVSEAEALARLDLDFDIVIGKAREGVRTEAQFNAIDGIVDKIQHYTGGVLNEKVVAAAVATVYTVAEKAVSGSVKKAAGMFGLGMAATGATAALRESRKLEVERMQHAREMAQGQKFDGSKAKRREEMEKSRFQTVQAKDLENNIKEKLFDKLATKEAKDLTEQEYNQAMEVLADIDSRIQVSDGGVVLRPKDSKWKFWKSNKAKRIDLIGYSDITKVEEERKQLDISRARATIQLKKWAEAHGNRDLKADLNAKKDNKIQDLFQGEKGILEQQKQFHEFKKHRVWQAFKKAALVGGAIGLVFQETAAFFSGKEGMAEHFFKGDHGHQAGEHVTLAEGVRRRITQYFEGTPVHAASAPGMHEALVVNGHHFNLPNGDGLRPDGQGGYLIYDSDGHTINTNPLHMDANGNLDQASIHELQAHGFNVQEHIDRQVKGIQGLNEEETKKLYPDLKEHARQDWHDNHNPDKEYAIINGAKRLIEHEGKQQQLYLGRTPDGLPFVDGRKMLQNLINNVDDDTIKAHPELFGINDDGTIDQQLNDLKAAMGSAFENGEMYKHLQFAIIPTEGANKLGVSELIAGFDENGKLVLPEPWASMFTDPKHFQDGHLPFRFGEMRYDGHVLATAQGAPEILNTPITEIIPQGEGVPVPPGGLVSSPDDFITVPPFPLYFPRRPGLEETYRVPGEILPPKEDPPIYPYNGSSVAYGDISPQERESYLQDMSPRLVANHNSHLNPAEEIPWYFENQNNRYKEKGYVQELENLDSQIPGTMSPNTEAVICLAVAGHQEQKNIFRTLEVYSKQTNKDGSSVWQGDKSKFEVLLYVNWPMGADPSETLSEIERFKKEHPEVLIKVVQQENNKKEQLGWLKKKVFDLALLRQTKRGLPDKDVILIANDADMRYAAPKYLSDILQTINSPEYKNCDAFLGRFDLDPEVYAKNPTFHSAMRYWEIAESIMRTKHHFLYTQGRNTIMRGSSYAAVGGNRDETFGADTEFGKLFTIARHGNDCLGFLNRDWVMVDPRREIDKFKSGEKIAWTWSDFDGRQSVRGGGKAIHKEPENLDVDLLADADEDDEIVKKFREKLQEEAQAIQDSFVTSKLKNPADAAKVAKRTAGSMGIGAEVKVVNGQVILSYKDTKRLRQALKKYKDEERQLTKIGEQQYEGDIRLPAELKASFKENPFKFIFHFESLDKTKTKLAPEEMVKALFEANGLGDQYEQAKIDAPKIKNASQPQRTLAQMLKLLAEKNPGIRQQWQKDHSRAYETWALHIAVTEIRKDVASGGLTDAKIDGYARESNLSAMKIIESIFKSVPSWQKKAEGEYIAAGSVPAQRETIYRRVLQEVQKKAPAPAPRPVSGPRPLGRPVPGRPTAETRPAGPPRAAKGPEAVPDSPEDIVSDPVALLKALRGQ